ncbi:unnamed protein product [Mytilus coruscus]|uniref:Nephrocystin 3-like N-terminal domain-containing protein n=1 Tax=Mytilus coruscus TaxID=42192 RepID=A0A6J8ET33_MYTCO|nr:unnamed protein product [Mytilus coruscus]
MLKWVKCGFCPNYFIPGENLFDGKLSASLRLIVENLLEHILDIGFECFFYVKSNNLCDFARSRGSVKLTDQLQVYSQIYYKGALYVTNMTITINTLSFFNHSVLGYAYSQLKGHIETFIKLLFRTLEDTIHNGTITGHKIEDTTCSLSSLTPYIYTCLASIISAIAIQNQDTNLRDFLLFGSHIYFMKGGLHGRLKFISVLYAIGLYNECEWCLDQLDEEYVMINPSFCFCSKSKLPPYDWCSTCTTWRESIEKSHRDQRSVNWSEIDSSKLSTDQFEVEKCFLPKCCLTSNRLIFPCNDVAATIGKIMNFENLYVEFSSTVKPQKIWKIKNQLANVTWISFARKVELCDTIMTFLKTSPVYTRHSVARTSYNKIKILTKKSYDDIISGDHIRKNEISELHKRVIPKVSRLNIYICAISILFICLGIIVNKTVTSELDFRTRNVISYLQSSDSCNLGYGLHFDFYLQQQRNFVERKWLIDETFHRINVTRVKGVIMIAGPNYGISAFVADIIRNKEHYKPKGYKIIYHICKRDVKTLQMPEKFVLNLMQRISCVYPRYQQLLGKLDTQWTDIKGMCIYDPYYCLDSFVINLLHELETVVRLKLLIIVDAIDQCYSRQMGVQLVSLLQARYTEFPSWVKFLFTTRNDSSILQQFSDLDHFHLLPEKT